MGNLISTSSETTITTTPNYIEPSLATNVINKQQQIITNLQTAISDTRNLLKIDANTNTKSSFVNINPISDYYTPPFYLANSNTPEVKDYINKYNQSIELLDDPNLLNKAQFDTYIHLQNKKINELQNVLSTFPTNNAQLQPIKAIKNIKTSNSLNVEEYPNSQNGNGSTTYPNYLIYGNNGCLSYNASKNNWAFKSCNANDSTQRFTITKINTKDDYNAKIINPKNQSYQIQDTNSVIMGFYSVNPETDNNQCLQLNTDGLSVMPCTMESSQRFKTLYHSVNP